MLGEVKDYITEGENHYKHKHVIKIKNRTGESFHFLVVSAKSDSSLRIGPWSKKSLSFKERRGVAKGFLFVNEQGRRLKLKGLESYIFDRVARVQSAFPELIRDLVDVHGEYVFLDHSEEDQTQRFLIEDWTKQLLIARIVGEK